ncbi:cation transporter [Cyanobium sp. ATX 6A2]|uniref:cation transporter n=1 Tax=Cyanobium sp. ATX 6A2 TaxID=2823700 RepID=UPI0020CDAAC2|nr:cation transporter [Cyanobium sp. ATX 6A2]MCP9889415.1 cation transporter [Cyanobium sp. ATX 6A2]
MAQGSSKAVACCCGAEQAAELQRRALWVVLVINAAMFVVELAVGLRAGSTGLIADSLDMLADAGVYGLSLGAVGPA